MANKDKLERYILLKSEHPEMSDEECQRKAGYSELRIKAGAVASALRNNIHVQARLAAIRNQRLTAAPTLDSYHATLNAAKEAAMRRGDPWVLLQIAALEGKEVLQPVKPGSESPALEIKFVESLLPPEQTQAVNKFVSESEARAGLPQGWSGRLTTEPQPIQAQPPALKPVPHTRPEGAVLELPISDEERRRLHRLCLPVGGALRTHHCRAHGEYECIWQQRADQTWGWSDCPVCWQKVN